MATLTFGKYKGSDPQQLAKTSRGRDYLSWGSANLESPKWRKEFQEALNTVELDLNAEADEISREDGLSWEEAYSHAVEEKTRIERDNEALQALEDAEATLRSNLLLAGVPQAALNSVVGIITMGDFLEAIKYGKIQFSSKDREYAVRSAVAQYEIDFEAVEIW